MFLAIQIIRFSWTDFFDFYIIQYHNNVKIKVPVEEIHVYMKNSTHAIFHTIIHYVYHIWARDFDDCKGITTRAMQCQVFIPIYLQSGGG